MDDDGFNQSVLEALPPAEPPRICEGCGEEIGIPFFAHANCVKAFNRAQEAGKKTIEKLRDDLARQTNERIDIEDRLAKLEPELDLLRLQVSPPSDEKEEGIRAHAFDALENFFCALSSFRKDVEHDRMYALADSARTLLETVDALMFLDERTRPALDDLRPALESLGEIDRLGWFRERYGSGRIDAVRTFLALDILRRTIGLKPRPATAED